MTVKEMMRRTTELWGAGFGDLEIEVRVDNVDENTTRLATISLAAAVEERVAVIATFHTGGGSNP